MTHTSHTPNQLLRQARMGRPSPACPGKTMSRQELADAVNKHLAQRDAPRPIDANHIGKLERGVYHWPSADYRQALRTVLGAASDADLGFYAHRRSTTASDTVQTWLAWAQHTINGDGSPAATLAREVAMAADDSNRFIQAGSGTVNRSLLNQLHNQVAAHAVAYLAQPPFAMFTPLARLRREVFAALDQRQAPALLPELYQIAGQLSALLAHACADLGQPDLADTHARTAWMCAELGTDPALKVYIRWVQSNTAYWNRQYRRAAELAHDGRTYASSGTGLLRLLSQEARALAACGEHSEVATVLGQALAERDRVAGDELPGVFEFGVGKAAYYACEVRTELGGADNLRLAIGDAAEAIALLDQQPDDNAPELLAAARLDMAHLHLARDDLDAAAIHLREVLDLSSASRTQPIVSRMNRVRTTLNLPRLQSAQRASDLDNEIALFLAYPATQQPPALPL